MVQNAVTAVLNGSLLGAFYGLWNRSLIVLLLSLWLLFNMALLRAKHSKNVYIWNYTTLQMDTNNNHC